jgi:putative FmdB family regulatory protein
MPTYEYSCQKCGEQIEVFQSFSAKPLEKHQDCGGQLKKVFHPRGVVFKGSGFYKTDSKKPASTSSPSSGKESSSTGKDSSSTGKGSGSTGKESSSTGSTSTTSSDS